MTDHDRICIGALAQLFPELSPAEQQVVILNAVMNMSTKGIAKYRGVEVTSIETVFLRARKKLNCQTINELRGVVNLRIMARQFLPSEKELLSLEL